MAMRKCLEISLLDASLGALESFFLGLPKSVLESDIFLAQMNLFFQQLDSAGQLVGNHAHAYQAFLFQEVDPIDQSSNLRDFEWSSPFTPAPLNSGSWPTKEGRVGS
jgi:hypothetical protein